MKTNDKLAYVFACLENWHTNAEVAASLLKGTSGENEYRLRVMQYAQLMDIVQASNIEKS